jgi:purine-binding chemotaxis protein CheW
MEESNGIAEDNRYLVFKLDSEFYAVDVRRVEVVLEYTPITRVPRSAEHLRGVINHRGTVVPVIDLKKRFGMGYTDALETRSIIVMQIEASGEQTMIGALADGVEEVIDLDPTRIDAAPSFGGNLKTEFILGLGKKDDSFIILLDIDAVFADDGGGIKQG